MNDKRKTRRDFLAEQIKFLAAATLIPAPLASMLRVTRVEPEADKAKAANGMRKAEKKPIDELAKPYIGEKLKYELTFLNVVDAGKAQITFEQDYGGGYVGTIDVKTTKAVAKLTKHREQTFTSRMTVKTVDGSPRFVTSIHTRIAIKEGEKYRSTHRFVQGKWYYMKFVGDKKVKTKSRKMKAGTYYEDLVAAFYNFRAGAYGKPEKGKKYTVNTIPHKGVKTFSYKIASDNEMKKEKKWIKGNKGAEYMMIVEIDQKIFGGKRGEALLLADKRSRPLSAKVRDVTGFGDVYANKK
jgi:Protein of unknown function (DUF3108)